jgi:hypothetical protein
MISAAAIPNGPMKKNVMTKTRPEYRDGTAKEAQMPQTSHALPNTRR